jgi:hypothetical protein
VQPIEGRGEKGENTVRIPGGRGRRARRERPRGMKGENDPKVSRVKRGDKIREDEGRKR